MIELKDTGDGSHTLYNPQFNATYHSTHGAIAESEHIYIKAGLHYALERFGKKLNILEAGFGSGLNSLLTFKEAEVKNLEIRYTGIEKYPLAEELALQLNYPVIVGESYRSVFENLHSCDWNSEQQLSEHFILKKIRDDIRNTSLPENLNLVYYDAFAPDAAPDMWHPSIFETLFHNMLPGACLVTFCAKGEIKRMLKTCGFNIEALAGPKGKREITRALR